MVHGNKQKQKTDGRQADLENDQISATWTPKMEPESSQWLRRMSKKGPMSQQWRRLGDRRHSRKQKGAQRMPMEGPNKAQKTKSKPTWAQQGSKKVSKQCPNERSCKKMKIELSPARELSSAHERTPQMEPQNRVAHRKHRNEAQGAP